MELTHFSGKHVEHLLPPASYIVKMSGFLRVYIIANWIPLVVDSWSDKTSNFNMSRWVLGNRVDRFFFCNFLTTKWWMKMIIICSPRIFCSLILPLWFVKFFSLGVPWLRKEVIWLLFVHTHSKKRKEYLETCRKASWKVDVWAASSGPLVFVWLRGNTKAEKKMWDEEVERRWRWRLKKWAL